MEKKIKYKLKKERCPNAIIELYPFGNLTCIDKVNENMKKEGGPSTNIGGMNRTSQTVMGW